MLTSVLIKLGMAIFSALPIERILAALLNKWINRIDPNNIERARKTAEHLSELSGLFNDILKDESLTAAELTQLKDEIILARKELMAAWALGKNAKLIQNELWENDGNKVYADPLLKDSGCARVVLLLAVAVCGVGLLAGCGTMTRCQTMRFEGCYIIVNEPGNLENPSYPRSVQVGVQDQQIEGGSDKIASGNETQPTVTIPLGDSGIGAVMGALGSMLPAKAAAPAATNGGAGQ
jgi:hypothetical protein